MFAEIFSIAFQFADVFAFLVLASAGLAIIFGMMGIINMAHGEFITCGIYVTVIGVQHGLPLPVVTPPPPAPVRVAATTVAGGTP